MTGQLTIAEAFCQKQFYLVLLMDFLTMFPLYYLASVFKTMGMQLGHIDDVFLTWIGSLGALANGGSRIFWGPVYDKTGYKLIYMIVLAIELVVCPLMPIIVATNKYLYLIWVFLGYLCLGAHFIVSPNAIIQIFGLRSSVQLCSFIYVTRACSAFSGMLISRVLVSHFGQGSFNVMFYTSPIPIIASLIILTTCFKEEPIRKDVDDEFIAITEEK